MTTLVPSTDSPERQGHLANNPGIRASSFDPEWYLGYRYTVQLSVHNYPSGWIVARSFATLEQAFAFADETYFDESWDKSRPIRILDEFTPSPTEPHRGTVITLSPAFSTLQKPSE